LVFQSSKFRSIINKTFCSGGDLKCFINDGPKFARLEYQLDRQIAKFSKDYVAIIDGYAMGGGMGVSINGKFRIVTENAILAMPEANIGFIADVGASNWYNKCPGELGTYCVLTGYQAKATDAIYLKLATHYIERDRITELEEQLTSADLTKECIVKNILDKFQQPVGEPPIKSNEDIINRCFNCDTVEGIMDKLAQEKSEFAKQTLEKLVKSCPMSLKVILANIRANKNLDIDDTLKLDFRIGARMWARSDLREGVRARLVDKDNTPHWNPPSLQQIDNINSFFEPFPHNGEQELQYN